MTNRSLIRSLASREIQKTYKGSYLGFFWLFVQPIAMLCVYGFVFGFVLQARFGIEQESELSYALTLFAGLLCFQVFSECLTRSPTLITSHVNYVKKIVFPVELLAIAILASALFRAVLSFGIWMVFFVSVYGAPHTTIFYAPLVFIPLCAFSIGVAWIFSALGVYIRDLSQLVGVLSTATLFLSAIFYPLSLIPEKYLYLMYFNPMTSIVELLRTVAIRGEHLPLTEYTLLTGISILFMCFGFWLFQSLRRGFSDVL
ncbi:MAG: ABC transporter permease [bacterium]